MLPVVAEVEAREQRERGAEVVARRAVRVGVAPTGETVRQEGYKNAKYLVDMNIKLAFPFISLILLTIGIPLALRVKKGGTPLAVSIGMAVCFLYILILGLSRSLGLAGVLPPLFSAWLANFLFLFLGVYMMIHMER